MPYYRKLWKVNIILILFLLGIKPAGASLSGSLSSEAIAERLKPAGQVIVDGKIVVKKKDTMPPGSPGYIYKKNCAVCHKVGLAGAPKFRSKKDWADRLAEKGLQGILKAAIQGYKAMPAKGNCIKCTDEELLQTIEYMIEDMR